MSRPTLQLFRQKFLAFLNKSLPNLKSVQLKQEVLLECMASLMQQLWPLNLLQDISRSSIEIINKNNKSTGRCLWATIQTVAMCTKAALQAVSSLNWRKRCRISRHKACQRRPMNRSWRVSRSRAVVEFPTTCSINSSSSKSCSKLGGAINQMLRRRRCNPIVRVHV